MSDAREAVMELARQLSEQCTWDEVMYRIYVRQKIESGIRDADEGRVLSHEEVFKELANDSDPMD